MKVLTSGQMNQVDQWTAGAGIPKLTARIARRVEEEGFDGLGLVDSQNLAGDPFVELGQAASVTSRGDWAMLAPMVTAQ